MVDGDSYMNEAPPSNEDEDEMDPPEIDAALTEYMSSLREDVVVEPNLPLGPEDPMDEDELETAPEIDSSITSYFQQLQVMSNEGDNPLVDDEESHRVTPGL